jgi:acyl-CoA synthetase (AMP-forming)/AMP-acid ligase II
MNNLGEWLAEALARSGGALQGASSDPVAAPDIIGAAIAGALRDFAVRKDELVMLVINNEPIDVVGYLGIWNAGAVAVPVHGTSPRASVLALRERTGARFVVVAGKVEQWAAEPPPARAELAGAAIVVFTSGSTGTPKGVIVGHRALCFKLGVLAKLLAVTPSDTVLVPLQLTFIFGIWVALLGLLAAAKVTLISKLTAETSSRFFPTATIFAAVPTMLRSVTAQNGVEAPLLRKILSGGEPLSPALAASLAGRFPSAGVYDLFGLTETGSCDFCLPPSAQPAGLGTIGRPTEGVEFRIAPVENSVAGAGELQIRTPSIMLGYLDEPELTAGALEQSYFKTGDLARLRDDGLVELVGRSKDIISRGANKIAPLEIDHLFAQHPDVIAAMSVGVADDRLGEALHVLIVRRAASEATEAALRDWGRERIEKFKLPDRIHFCDSLPLGRTGKADRKAAAAYIAERLRRHGAPQ